MSLRGEIRGRWVTFVTFMALVGGACVSTPASRPLDAGSSAGGNGGHGDVDAGTQGGAGGGAGNGNAQADGSAGGIAGIHPDAATGGGNGDAATGAGGSGDAATGMGGNGSAGQGAGGGAGVGAGTGGTGPGMGGNGPGMGGNGPGMGGNGPGMGGNGAGVGGGGGTAAVDGARATNGTLSVDLTAASNPVAPSGRALYTLTIGNLSNHAVDGIGVLLRIPVGLQLAVVNDALPNATCPGFSICPSNGEATWAVGTLAAGVSARIVVNAQVLQTVGDGDAITVPFTVSATGLNAINVVKTVQVLTQQPARLALGTVTNPVTPGQRFTLDLDVGQVGATPLTTTTLTATLPAGLTVSSISDGGTQAASGDISWPLGTIAVGAGFHRSVDVTLAADAAAGSILKARAALAFDGGAPVDVLAEYSISVVAAPLPLHVDVSVTPSPAEPGGRILYTTTISNTSLRAVDGVTVIIRVPAGLQFAVANDAQPNASCPGFSFCPANVEASWALGTLAAGSSLTVVMNAQVLANAVGDGALVTLSTFVGATGVFYSNVVKTVQILSRPSAQLVVGTVSDPVTPGQPLVFDFDVGQIGPAALAATELRATLPAGFTVTAVSDGGTQPSAGQVLWSIGGVAVGAALHRTVTGTVDAALPAGATLPVRGVLTYNGGAAVDAIAEYTVSVIAAAQPLTVTVTATPSPVAPGTRLLYTVKITNVSARAVDGVNVAWRVPAGTQFAVGTDAQPNAACPGFSTCPANVEATWALGTLAVGGIQNITINAQVLATLIGGSLISGEVFVSATGMAESVKVRTTVPTHP